MKRSQRRSWRSLGFSRRQKTAFRAGLIKCQLGFESLEERRMMVYSAAASFPAQPLVGFGFDGVVNIGNCTGTLLSTGRHILTAAHCVDTNYDGIVDGGSRFVTFALPTGNRTISVASVTVYSPWATGGNLTAAERLARGGDLAILELSDLAPFAAERRTLYSGSDEVGQNVVFVGLGGTNRVNSFVNEIVPGPVGTIASGFYGHDGSFGVKRLGFNRIDSISTLLNSQRLNFDTDNPNSATDPGIQFEAGGAPGDSGGPLLINNQIAGVLSTANPGFIDDGRGQTAYTRISTTAVTNWINSTVAGTFDLVLDMTHQLEGNDGAPDSITITASSAPLAGNILNVTINGVTFTEKLSDVRSVTVKGSNDSDAIRFVSTNVNLEMPITVFAGSGIDSITIDDSAQGIAGPWAMRLYSDKIERQRGVFPFVNTQTTTFSSVESFEYRGGSETNAYFLHGSPAMASGFQTTIYTSGNSDDITVYPRSGGGSPSILGTVGILGQGGADTITFDDSASTAGATWNVYNPFGANTQSFQVAGGATVGAFLDVESVRLNGSSGHDAFNIDSYMNGSALRINGGGGDDAVNITPNTQNLAAYITSMSFFEFDGSTGANSFNVNNAVNNTSWQYTRTNAQLQTVQSGTSYFGNYNLINVGAASVVGGPQADTMIVDGTPAESRIDYYGGGSGDGYLVLSDPNNPNVGMQGIRGPVVLHGDGSDYFNISDGESTGRTFHATATRVGAEPGDNLFGPGGYVEIIGTGTILGIVLGSGADTVYAVPNPSTPLQIEARDPMTTPGDKLTLSLGGVTSPVFTPLGVGTGYYSFGNAASFAYTGFETAATVVPGDFNGDGAVNGADLADWRVGFGMAAGAAPANGDADADADVDGHDFLAWQRQFAVPAAVAATEFSATTSNGASPASSSVALSSIDDAEIPYAPGPPSKEVVARADTGLASRVAVPPSTNVRPLGRRNQPETRDHAIAAFGPVWKRRNDLTVHRSSTPASVVRPVTREQGIDAQQAWDLRNDDALIQGIALDDAFASWA